METVFVFCAAVGGTIMVIQFLLGLVGLGGHIFDADVSTDVGHDFGGDFHGDAGGDFHGDAGGDLHGDAGGDFHGDAVAGESDTGALAGHAHQYIGHGSTWLFKVLSFRAIVAALAFFGIAGLWARSAQYPPHTVLLFALAAGAAAMVVVYWLMRGLQTMQAEGNVRIQRAVGQRGNVYLRVPANRSGSGKIQFNLQNRTMEYLAVTSGPELRTGTKVVVVGVVNPTTLEVQADQTQPGGVQS
jgi:membrane protein implicated in regulation of membrane protease activity